MACMVPRMRPYPAVPDQALSDMVFGARGSESLVARKLEADQAKFNFKSRHR